MNNVRIKSKFRFTMFISIMLILSITFINTILGLNETNGTINKSYIQVEVSHGDTIWKIASEYANNSVDTREAVYYICKINNIKADELTAGMILNIPKDF